MARDDVTQNWSSRMIMMIVVGSFDEEEEEEEGKETTKVFVEEAKSRIFIRDKNH